MFWLLSYSSYSNGLIDCSQPDRMLTGWRALSKTSFRQKNRVFLACCLFASRHPIRLCVHWFWWDIQQGRPWQTAGDAHGSWFWWLIAALYRSFLSESSFGINLRWNLQSIFGCYSLTSGIFHFPLLGRLLFFFLQGRFTISDPSCLLIYDSAMKVCCSAQIPVSDTNLRDNLWWSERQRISVKVSKCEYFQSCWILHRLVFGWWKLRIFTGAWTTLCLKGYSRFLNLVQFPEAS